jgi:hypothetical protein
MYRRLHVQNLSYGNMLLHFYSTHTKIPSFLNQVKRSYPSAVGIIVLCILSSQIGQAISFVLFGYHDLFGIVMSYALGYGLASLTTFCTIIGRYNLNKDWVRAALP